MTDATAKPAGRSSTALVGGMRIEAVTLSDAARAMADEAVARRGLLVPPQYVTSANGQVLALYNYDAETRALFNEADIIHADGMPMVFASRFLCSQTLPERVATTDLVEDVMAISAERGLRHFLLGARPETNERAIAALRKRYPDVKDIAGHHGYFSIEEEAGIVQQINDYAPDILWVALGVPLEQRFVSRNRDKLTSVGVIKTSGGLFDFLAENVRRAPRLVQQIGMEWAWRMMQEPRRLGIRYGKTNPVALWLLATRSR